MCIIKKKENDVTRMISLQMKKNISCCLVNKRIYKRQYIGSLTWSKHNIMVFIYTQVNTLLTVTRLLFLREEKAKRAQILMPLVFSLGLMVCHQLVLDLINAIGLKWPIFLAIIKSLRACLFAQNNNPNKMVLINKY